jgi:hypothetical protein
MCILTMDQVKFNRYVLLNKDQVKDFKEDQLEVLLKKFIRSFKRQMTVYYNILNMATVCRKIQTISLVEVAHENAQRHRQLSSRYGERSTI